VERLFFQMLNARFGEIVRQPDAPFLGAGAGGQEIGAHTRGIGLTATVVDGGIPKGLDAVMLEARRAREYGFSQAELERARTWMLAAYDRALAEKTKSDSGSFAREYVSNFLDGEPIPGIDIEVQMAREQLPSITLAEVTATARELLKDDNRVVLATAPEKAATPGPTEASLRQTLASAATTTVEPWKETLNRAALIERLPRPGTVASTRTIPELGVTVLRFSNGAEVWLKPTDFKNDQIVFTSYALGGASLAPEADYLEASLAPVLVGVAGIGGLTPIELSKLMAGKLVTVQPYISLTTHGISGSSTPKDIEAALQLLYLTYTAPGAQPDAFDLLKRQMSAAVANRGQNPSAIFGDRVRSVNTLDHYTSRPVTPERVQALRLPVMADYYKKRFASAADFTFFFVGTFEVAKMTPLLAQYIGSLPSAGERRAQFTDLKFRFPARVEKAEVEKGKEPKSTTVMTFFAWPGIDGEAMQRANLVAEVLEIRLREVLREDLGGTYSVNVSFSHMLPQSGYGTVSVNFRLRDQGPSAEDVQKVKEIAKRDLETAAHQNGFWLNTIQSDHMLGRDPRELLKRMAAISAVTPEMLKAAAAQCFPRDRYTVVTLMPEPKPASP
jgi:zinc protease